MTGGNRSIATLAGIAAIAAQAALAQPIAIADVRKIEAESKEAGYLDGVLRACALEPYADELKKAADQAARYQAEIAARKSALDKPPPIVDWHRKAFAEGNADARATAFRTTRCEPEYRERMEKRAKIELRMSTEALSRLEAALEAPAR